MSDQDRLRVTFQDLNNDESVSLVYAEHDLAAAEVLFYSDYLAPLTSTHLTMVRQDISRVGPDPDAGANGDYPTCADMCTLEFTCADGSVQPVSFSAPVIGILKPDHSTVDPSQADVAAFIVFCLATFTSATGSIFVSYRSGRRWHLDP